MVPHAQSRLMEKVSDQFSKSSYKQRYKKDSSSLTLEDWQSWPGKPRCLALKAGLELLSF